MKALSILGTMSNAGKSWVATAFCALLRRRGYRVAPFKAQNMSNNSYVTLEGGEIGRAQAVQAEACGLRPVAEMNPVLLKPSGESTSQVVLHGTPGPHVQAGAYYRDQGQLWEEVRQVLDSWKSSCDVLVMEGAGSPVELNLMDRDIVNLRPINYLDGRWILVSDIERGGVFAQTVGTWTLLPESSRRRGLGWIANKFRGDLRLFDGVGELASPYSELPYLGALPMVRDLQPENEDSLSHPSADRMTDSADQAKLAWIRFPRLSNSSDCQPWETDGGVCVQWVDHPEALRNAAAIILPGTKDTLADLNWLKQSGLADAITRKSLEGTPVVGICGGFQMMGERLIDADGVAGTPGDTAGLGLLPVTTVFQKDKHIEQVHANFGNSSWTCYEIHNGRTHWPAGVDPLFQIERTGGLAPEGVRLGKIWGSYLHGMFESAEVRRALALAAGIRSYQTGIEDWQSHKRELYDKMADVLESHLNLEPILRYVEG